MTDPTGYDPFAAPYELNPSSAALDVDGGWPMALPPRPPEPPRRRRRWVLPLVLIAIVAVTAALGTTIASELQGIHQRVAEQPAVPGVPDAPAGSDRVPSDPPTSASIECPPTCLTVAVSGLLVPNGSLLTSSPVGQQVDSPDFQDPSTAAIEYRDGAQVWALTRSPQSCFFMSPPAPVGAVYGDADSTSQDPVTFLGETSDASGGSTVTEEARFFPTSAAATSYMRGVREQQPLCQSDDHAVQSTPFAITELDSNSYTETRGGGTISIYDIQRANVVVRFQVVSDDHVDSAAVAHFLATWTTTDLEQVSPE